SANLGPAHAAPSICRIAVGGGATPMARSGIRARPGARVEARPQGYRAGTGERLVRGVQIHRVLLARPGDREAGVRDPLRASARGICREGRAGRGTAPRIVGGYPERPEGYPLSPACLEASRREGCAAQADRTLALEPPFSRRIRWPIRARSARAQGTSRRRV